LDSAGTPIAGATVILKSPSSDKEIAKAVTGEKGEYSLSAAPGEYSIEASSTCFLTARYKPFYTIDQSQNLDLVLAAADCGGLIMEPVRSKLPEPLDLCVVLPNLAKYSGKEVAIRGEFISYEHGRVIAKDKCLQPLVTSGYTWPNMISLERALTSVSVDATCWRAMATPGPSNTQIWVTVQGRLETRAPGVIVLPFVGKTVPDGYGHMNSYPAQIVYSQMRDCIRKPFAK
jgi:hypothetical protein